jgi:hypothetical protein
VVANDSGSMGLNYRRRVIYQALQNTFADPQQLRLYFELWQREHSQETHFVVTRFAAAVAKVAGLDAEQKSLFQRRLFQGLTQPYESLPRVPDAWMPAANQTDDRPFVPEGSAVPAARAAPAPAAAPVAPEPVARIDSVERIVFKAFAQPIAAAILAKADRHPGVLQQAVDDLDTGTDSRTQALHRAFKQWSGERFASDALPPLHAPEDLQHLAHQLYLLATDLIGPMQADRLLAQAAAEAERLPEAALFSPQMLL